MEAIKDEVSESGEGEELPADGDNLPADSEDLPSDFFDDFNKAEFMEGLSVIDECWDDSGAPQKGDARPRYIAETLDSVKDLRELISEKNDGEDNSQENIQVNEPKRRRKCPLPCVNSKYKWFKGGGSAQSNPDNIIKPGSRRDPSKTNEAIKKDKEVKVQQYLAKSLESTDDLRPPGTELDDYYEEKKKEAMVDSPSHERVSDISLSPHRIRRSPRRYSPRMRRGSPRMMRRSPRQRYSPRGSPRRTFRHQSPGSFRHRQHPPPFKRFSPGKSFRRNYDFAAHGHHSPFRRSPPRYHSPERRSPRRQHRSRSRSPRRRHDSRRSRSRSRTPRQKDNFLYPNEFNQAPNYPIENPPYQPEIVPQYAPPMHPGSVPGYSYAQVPAYDTTNYTGPDPYIYGGAPLAQPTMPSHTPAPALLPNPVAVPMPVNPVPAPAMVPAPTVPTPEQKTPYDALAQLVAEGKISQADYLKLTPNKGVTTAMDTKSRVMVLTRCNQALSKLDKLLLPNRLTINSQLIGSDDQYLEPQYCSPLKRQAVTEFGFTKGLGSSGKQTKQLVESIISTLGMDKVISKYKKKLPKDIKDVGIQTTKPQCDVCEIREMTSYRDVGTSTEPEYFTSTVHTQVVEQDLVSSKSIFNPSGSMGEGAAISIAHLTPAQLVSQLAARAKTLKQPQESPPPPNQYNRRGPPNYNYDPRQGHGGQHYHHPYNNYRY